MGLERPRPAPPICIGRDSISRVKTTILEKEKEKKGVGLPALVYAEIKHRVCHLRSIQTFPPSYSTPTSAPPLYSPPISAPTAPHAAALTQGGGILNTLA